MFKDKENKVYSSIFDAVSRIEKDKTVKKETPKEAAQAEKKQVEKKQEERKGDRPTIEELKQAYNHYKELYKLLQQKIDDLLAKKKLTYRMIHNYFNSPRNFSSEQWRLIEKQKEEVERKLRELVPEHPQKRAESKDEPQQEKKAPKKEYKPKSMQVKSRWIPMR
ncbi:MAG: hypothetical protein JSR46_02485 [Verrucomicrobia bacterium]|nr:hypothetical protein [Verrucomicrobiota bacterium]